MTETSSIVHLDADTVIVWARSKDEAVLELAAGGVDVVVGDLVLDDRAYSVGGHWMPFRFVRES